MTAIELKRLLIQRIEEINDESFLSAIKTILDAKSQSQTLNLTKEQRSEILKSQKDIEEGLFFDQSEMDQKFSKWLSAK